MGHNYKQKEIIRGPERGEGGGHLALFIQIVRLDLELFVLERKVAFLKFEILRHIRHGKHYGLNF